MAVSDEFVVTVPLPKKFKTHTWPEPNKSMRHMLILLGLYWGLQGVPGDSPAGIYRFVGCFKTVFWGMFLLMGTFWDPKGICSHDCWIFCPPTQPYLSRDDSKMMFLLRKDTFCNRPNRTKKTKSSNSDFRSPPHIYELPYMAPTRIQACEIGPGMVL